MLDYINIPDWTAGAAYGAEDGHPQFFSKLGKIIVNMPRIGKGQSIKCIDLDLNF